MNKLRNQEEINHIIYLLKNMNKLQSDLDNFKLHPAGSKYLLGQTLRQLILPESNIFHTYKAITLWKKLTCDSRSPISDYVWQKKVTSEFEEELLVSKYIGASKNPTQIKLNKGDSFSFREVFHDEHIIPIRVIIEELCKLKNPNYESVQNIIKEISICRMLKIEDRLIKEKSKRTFSRKEIIENIYSKYNIYLVEYDYPKFKSLIDDNLKGSIHLLIPKESIIKYYPHPEPYGDKIIELANGMTTDVYENENKDLYSITNDTDLIRYVKILQEVYSN